MIVWCNKIGLKYQVEWSGLVIREPLESRPPMRERESLGKKDDRHWGE